MKSTSIEELKKSGAAVTTSSSPVIINALVLPITHLKCKSCGKMTQSAGELMLELSSINNPSKKVFTKPTVRSLELPLPRRKKHLTLDIPMCEECFDIAAQEIDISSSTQLSLFPQPKFEEKTQYQLVADKNLRELIFLGKNYEKRKKEAEERQRKEEAEKLRIEQSKQLASMF